MAAKKMSKSITHTKKLFSPLPRKSDREAVRKKVISSEPEEVTIVTSKPDQKRATFYIQSKGEHAGRPLKSPIPNCWAVYSKVPHLYEIAFSLYRSGHLKTMLIGSVIPYLRLGDYKPILMTAAKKAHYFDRENLRTLELLDARIQNLTKQITLLGQYQRALAYKINRQLNVI